MPFQHIFHTIPLSVNDKKESLFKITEKLGYLSLAALLSSSVLTIEADGIKENSFFPCPSITRHGCTVEPVSEEYYASYSQSTKAKTPLTFDYDPNLLPEVAEVIFVLRIKQANIGKQFVINFSGNYLLQFTKDKIYILDTYTKNNDMYEYQSTNPNITIGLGVSTGLPRNYKSIIIKEDANGILYSYAALRSDNITTDELMLSETLNHPFYEIAGKDGINDEVDISKAMVFYHKAPSHKRHARCIKSSMNILVQLRDILASGSAKCGPKADLDIFSANHKSVEEMKLEGKLVEATFDKRKPKFAIDYELELELDLNNLNALAFVISSLRCDVSIEARVESRRRKRAPGKMECLRWTTRLIQLFISLRLDVNQVHQIVQSIATGGGILASHFLNGEYPTDSNAQIEELVQNINLDVVKAERVLEDVARVIAQAMIADPAFQANNPSAAGAQASVAEGKLGIYKLTKEQFRPLPNTVRRLDSNLHTVVINDGQYTTKIFHVTNGGSIQHNIVTYRILLKHWRTRILLMMKSRTNAGIKNQLARAYYVANAIYKFISRVVDAGIDAGSTPVISAVYHNYLLVGISIGEIHGRVYHPLLGTVSPDSLLQMEGAYEGAIAYLTSDVLNYLFSKDLIDSSIAFVISQNSLGSFTQLGFGHDEL